MKTVSSKFLVITLMALPAFFVVSPVSHATEVLINTQNGAVRVLGQSTLNGVTSPSLRSEKRESARERRAQTAKQIAERKGVGRLPIGAILAVTTSNDGSVSQLVPLMGERARVMDRPFQKNGLQATASDALYTLPTFLMPSNSIEKVEIELWKKVGDRQFAWLTAL